MRVDGGTISSDWPVSSVTWTVGGTISSDCTREIRAGHPCPVQVCRVRANHGRGLIGAMGTAGLQGWIFSPPGTLSNLSCG